MQQSNSSKKVKYVIVGGGLSGLSAGRKLQKELHIQDFVILEAHDRVGGRICTQLTEKGNLAELGASWIGPTQTRLYELSREYGLELIAQYEQKKHVIVMPDGKLLRYTGFIPPVGATTLIRYLINQLKIERLANTVNLDNPSLTKNAAYLDSITFDDYLKKQVRGIECQLINRALEVVFGSKTCNLSLLQGLYYIKSGQGLDSLFKARGGAQHHKFVKGTQALTDALALELQDKIVLNAPVKEILQNDTGVTVITQGVEYSCERVIVACPPQTLNNIAFTPSLLPSRHQYIEKVRADNNCYKILVFYSRPFWRENNMSGLVLQFNGIIINTFDGQTDPQSKKGKLIAFVDKDEYSKLKSLSLSQKCRVVAEELAKFFGPEALNYEEMVPNEIFTKDIYIPGCPVGVAEKGAFSGLNEGLFTPYKRIHWASTETARVWQGYMEGAVRSGERAACEVAGVQYRETPTHSGRGSLWFLGLLFLGVAVAFGLWKKKIQ